MNESLFSYPVKFFVHRISKEEYSLSKCLIKFF